MRITTREQQHNFEIQFLTVCVVYVHSICRYADSVCLYMWEFSIQRALISFSFFHKLCFVSIFVSCSVLAYAFQLSEWSIRLHIPLTHTHTQICTLRYSTFLVYILDDPQCWIELHMHICMYRSGWPSNHFTLSTGSMSVCVIFIHFIASANSFRFSISKCMYYIHTHTCNRKFWNYRLWLLLFSVLRSSMIV